MAKNFNNGVIVYDAQVAKFDMTLMSHENIDFPANVIKSLNYLAADVVYEFDLSFDIATIRQGELQKLARMGHIQAAKDFTAAEALAADQARVTLKGQMEGYADQAEADAISSAGAYTDGREVVLQGNINAEIARATAAEAANALAHSTFKTAQETFNGDIGMEVAANKTASEAADAVLTADLATEVSDRIAAVNGVTVSLATEAATARAAEAANAAAITAEQVRAEAAELGLQGSINEVTVSLATEASTARAAEAANAAAITAEASRASGEETLIRGEFAAADAAKLQEAKGYTDQEVLAEKTRAEAAEAGLQSSIDAEAATARAAEGVNAAAITAENVRAVAAETQLANELAQEETDRLAGEAVLEGKIDTEKGRIDAILLASDADKDSFAEIVTLVNSIDAENDQAFAGHVSAYNTKMGELDAADAAEQAARIAGDAAVQSDLDAYKLSNDAALSSEEAARIAADAGLQAGLDAEIASTNTRFASATSDRGAIRSEFAAADTAMETAFTAEIDALKVQDGTHTAAISANASAVLTEKARAEAAEGVLAAAVSAEETRALGQEAAIRSEFAAADVALKGQMEIYTDGAVDGEKVRAEAAELVLTNAVSTEQAARLAGDTAIRGTSPEGAVFGGSLFGLDQAMATKEAASNAADAALQAGLDAEEAARIAGDAQGLVDAKAYTDAEVSSEAALRVAADAGLQGQINTVDGKVDDEKVRAEAAELALSNSISAEQQRATAAEGAIAADLAQELLDRAAADTAAASFNLAARNAIQADVDANEVASSSSFAAASAARGAIAADLAQELLDRAAGDVQGLADAKAYTDAEIATMQASLDAEIAATNADFAAAEQARIGLAGEIGVEKGRIDAILAGADADKDSFAEIVALVNSVDVENDTAFAGHVSAYNTKMGLLDGVDAAATTDRAAIRSELASEKATLQAEFAAADAVVTAAYEAADLAMKEGLESDIDDEIAARVAGDLALDAAYKAADAAEESARITADNNLTASLNAEVTRATGVEAQLQSKMTDMHNGETTVNFISNAVASASIMMPSGFAHQIVVNSGASAMATLPVMGPNFKMTLTFAAAGSEAMEFHAPAGMVIDGEADAKITLYPGSSVTFLENAGVYYMV